MSAISRLLERRTSDDYEGFIADRARARRGGGFAAPLSISPDQALRHGTVWACSTYIADMDATLPWDSYRKTAAGVRESTNATLIAEPSRIVDPVVWRTEAFMSLLLRGNVFGLVTEQLERTPSKIELVSPDCVSWEKTATGREVWRVDGKVTDLWPIGPLWHAPGYTLPGHRLGLSVLSYAAATIGLGRNAEDFGRQWFTDSAHPSALLSYDGDLKAGQADEAKQKWMDKVHGTREPVVLGGKWAYAPVQIASEDSQFLETIAANVADVARFFRVPPSEVGGATGGGTVTYSNVESDGIALVRKTLGPWAIRLETALSRLLPRGQYVKANFDAFLRTDAKTRAEITDMELHNGMLNLDEGRAREDRTPVEGGDTHVWPPQKSTGGQPPQGAQP